MFSNYNELLLAIVSLLSAAVYQSAHFHSFPLSSDKTCVSFCLTLAALSRLLLCVASASSRLFIGPTTWCSIRSVQDWRLLINEREINLLHIADDSGESIDGIAKFIWCAQWNNLRKRSWFMRTHLRLLLADSLIWITIYCAVPSGALG